MTLIELMIAVIILSVVVAAAFSVSYSIMNSYREHRRAIGVERSVRGAMALLTEAVRGISPGVPDGQITDLVTCDSTFQTIRVDNRSDGPDAIDLVYAKGGVVTTLRAEFNENLNQITVEDGSKLRPDDQVLVTDFDRGHILQITGVSQSGLDWILTLAGAPSALCPGTFTYPTRSTVLRVQRARFEVDLTDMPLLYMDPDGLLGTLFDREPVAEGVEDLQIAIGVDLNGSGGIEVESGAAGNDDEWVFNHPDDSPPPAITTAPYRAIRITVTGRSVDETTAVATSLRPPAEDREGATVPDVFRRRSLSTTIEIRNLQGSP